jgi:hypothetical protein
MSIRSAHRDIQNKSVGGFSSPSALGSTSIDRYTDNEFTLYGILFQVTPLQKVVLRTIKKKVSFYLIAFIPHTRARARARTHNPLCFIT